MVSVPDTKVRKIAQSATFALIFGWLASTKHRGNIMQPDEGISKRRQG